MKRVFMFIMMITLSAILFSATVVTISDDVNVRDVPHSTKSKIVQKLSIGEKLDVLNTFHVNVKVQTAEGSIGYVYGGMIDQKTGEVVSPVGTVISAGTADNPGKQIAMAKKGIILTILEKSDPIWFKIESGWISSGYVKVVTNK